MYCTFRGILAYDMWSEVLHATLFFSSYGACAAFFLQLRAGGTFTHDVSVHFLVRGKFYATVRCNFQRSPPKRTGRDSGNTTVHSEGQGSCMSPPSGNGVLWWHESLAIEVTE